MASIYSVPFVTQPTSGSEFSVQEPAAVQAQQAAAPGEEAQTSSDFLQALGNYMQIISLATVLLAMQNAKISTAQSQASSGLVQVTAQQAAKAIQEMKKLVAEAEHQKKEGLFQKIASYCAGAILAVTGLLTGQPELMFMGMLMVAMTDSTVSNGVGSFFQNAADKIDSHGALGIKITLEFAAVLAVAALVTAVGGGGAAVETAESTAESAADSAAAGAGSAAGEAGAIAAEEATEEAVEEAATEEAAAKAKPNRPFMTRTLLNAAPIAAFTSFYTDLCMACGEIDRKHYSKEAAQIAGMVLGMAASITAGKFQTEGPSFSFFDQSSSGFMRTQKILMVAQHLAYAGNAVTDIMQGLTENAQANVLKKQASTKQLQEAVSASLKTITAQTQQSQAAAQQINQMYVDIDNRLAALVRPYAAASQIIWQQQG